MDDALVHWWTARIDFERLVLQWVLSAFAVGALLWLSRGNKMSGRAISRTVLAIVIACGTAAVGWFIESRFTTARSHVSARELMFGPKAKDEFWGPGKTDEWRIQQLGRINPAITKETVEVQKAFLERQRKKFEKLARARGLAAQENK